jgi:hypothetical protein
MNKKGIYILRSRRDAIAKFVHYTSFKNLKMSKAGSLAIKDLG